LKRLLLDQGCPRSTARILTNEGWDVGLDADALAALLRTIWPQIEADVQRGAVVSVDVTSVRVRALPIE